jgi:hypothetical protein
MLNIPDQNQFSGPKRDESMPENITAQWQWLNTIKTTGCIACHGIGTLGTRRVPAVLGHLALAYRRTGGRPPFARASQPNWMSSSAPPGARLSYLR